MKRQAVIITSAFLIVLIATHILMPFRAAAQPGNVVIRGQVTYQPRNWNPQAGNWHLAREIQVDLYEKDLSGNDHKLATTYTDLIGNFVFPSRTNWWSPDSRPLNVFIKLVTVYQGTKVTDRLGRNYAFASSTTFLSHDGDWPLDFRLTDAWPSYQAVWIFEDIRKAWRFVNTNYSPYDPGAVTAVWEQALNCYPIQLPDWLGVPCGSFAYGGIITHFIFITNDHNLNSMDTVVHETAHMFMINANGWWYTGCPTHNMFTASGANCAWSEGWADFFPLAVSSSRCYNILAVNPCQGVPDLNYYNLEDHSRADNQQQIPWGDTVEGRVAAALYDLYDYHNEGFDRRAGFIPIAQLALGSSQIKTFQDFWNNWKNISGQNVLLSGLTLWWNTINYVNIRQIILPVVRK